MSEKTRIVVDTNILLDIVYFDDPRIQNLKKALENKHIEAWSCNLIWEEFLDVLRRPAFFSDEVHHLKMIEQAKQYFQFETTTLTSSPFRCKDKDDQIFIDLAVSKAPCWLISRDLEVLKLAKRLRLVNVYVRGIDPSKIITTVPW